ncbi:MAG: arylsulfatase [Planctomycetota bacterium]
MSHAVSQCVLADPPHVVVIMADDLGWGDVTPLNPDSKIPTPAFERLASEGITFRDAHTPSAVCTPTRYGLLTGHYCWRTHLKRGVLNGYGKPLIDRQRATLGSVFRDAGYDTAVVGKWHLGLGLPGGGRPPEDLVSMNFSQPLSAYPGDHGFESSFVIPASLDFPPYVYFDNGRATTTKMIVQDKAAFPKFLRAGPRAADFDMEACLDRLADEAIKRIRGFATSDRPGFLYFPLTAPHKPLWPAERFRGQTPLGPYGDFVHQVDATIGRVLDAIDEAGISDNTLLVVTSDNGSYMYRYAETETDHTDDDSIQAYRGSVHTANGPWRGTKADIWEAGHRVPFFVRLPNRQHAGLQVDTVVGLIDLMATFDELLQLDAPESAGPDSRSFAAVLTNPSASWKRDPLVCHSGGGMFALRDGSWKLVAGNGSGGREQPKGKPFEKPYQLYDLANDPGETNDLALTHPDIVDAMTQQLLAIKDND